MGKVKLRSSIRALHQALCNLRPIAPKSVTWVCVQESKTHSFREVYKSYNSIYSDLCILNGEETEHDRLTTSSSTDLCSSSAESSDSSVEIVLSGLITGLSSKRFFFSPCTTNSIMEEANPSVKDVVELCSRSERKKIDLGFFETKKIDLGFLETMKIDLGSLENQFPEDFEFEKGEFLLGMRTGEETGELCYETGELCYEIGFCKESVTMAMNSNNPYLDFKVSMEEMVEAHDLREWSCLQELLHCYLKLNEKRTHKFIVGAFVDMIINLIAKANNREAFPPLLLQE